MSAYSGRIASCALALLSAASFGARSLGAQGQLVFVPVRVTEVMSPADRHRTGIDRLTPEQRFALDAWLTRYTAELRQALTSGPDRPTRAALMITPSGVRAARASTESGGATVDGSEANDSSEAPAPNVARRGERMSVPATAPARSRALARFVDVVPARPR